MTAKLRNLAAEMRALADSLDALADRPGVVEAPRADQRALLTFAEAGKHLAVSQDTARRLARSGDLEVVKVGTIWRVTRASCDAFVARQLEAARQPVTLTQRAGGR